ncbi:MAG: protein kinase [Myxococcota bacterium]
MLRGESLDPRIRIRAPLRCDGIGRLDCAEDAESGGRVAVRWLPLDANGDAAVKACAKLPEHPRLPRILQTGQVGGSAFVALDFPEGALLSTRVGERLEVDEVIRLGAQLSSALATVHAQGVVHGEMSCDSVLLVHPDHAYLWDMPLVIANRLTDRRGENRLMQNLVKTAPFLAPERARGEGASQASDVYALGAVLCVAAGAPLPVASTTLAVVYQVAQGKWTPRVPMVLPEPYRSTLALMVSEDPAARPPADEVAAIFAEVPPAASLPTVPEFPVVKLPPELLAAADALLRRPSTETPAVPAEPQASSAVDEGTADTLKRNAVAPARQSESATAKLAGETATAKASAEKSATSGPSLAQAVTAKLGGESATAKASAEKSATSGPSLAQAVTAKLGGESATANVTAEQAAAPPKPLEKTSTSGPTLAKVNTSGPSLAQVVTAKLNPERASTSGPSLAQAVTEKLNPGGAAGQASSVAAAVLPSAVQLTDTISVSHELADGAVTLSADEARALQRSRRQVIQVAAGLGGAILAMMLVVFVLAKTRGAPEALPAPRPAVVQPAAAPAPTPKSKPAAVDEDLAPLPHLPLTLQRPTAPKSSARPPEVRAAPRARPPAAPVEADTSAEVVTPDPTEPQDFGFLDSSAEAPTSELKRPSM